MNIINFIVDRATDAIVNGQWPIVLAAIIFFAVPLLWLFIWSVKSGGSGNINYSLILIVICVLAVILISKYAKKDDTHHPERFVGHVYQLKGSCIYASISEDGIWTYMNKQENKKKEPDYNPIGNFDGALYEKCGLVDLSDPSPGAERKPFGTPRLTQISIRSSSRGDTQVPLIKVEALNNKYSGALWWMPASELMNRYRHAIKLR